MFSKYEVYTTVQSMYCYKGTDVLRNRLKIHDNTKLKSLEEEIVAVKIYALMQNPIAGRFTKNHFLNIHKFLFGDIYLFAGRIRIEQISKGDTMFCHPKEIDASLAKLFEQIREFRKYPQQENLIGFTAFIMSELNIIHPFREGNGRTIREFIRQWLASFDIELNWGNIDHEAILDASILSVDDYTSMIPILNNCIIN